MATLSDIPHLRAHGMCPVNGIRDLVQWRSGRNWSNELVHGLGQGGGFAYLRIKVADPPRQVYWGVASPRQHRYLADLLGASCTEIEDRSFRFSWQKACQAVDAGTPPVLGPLDMYHLPFYDELYHKRHIPIHYLLLVGYDDQRAYVHDTDLAEVQELQLDELELAWDVHVPGLGKRSRLVTMDVPSELPPDAELIRQSIADQCETMLRPPVSMLGIPAMRKLAREIANWPRELGDEAAAKCLLQVREYLNSPPDLEGSNLTAGRHIYVRFLQEAVDLAGLEIQEAIDRLQETIATVPQLAAAVREHHLEEAASCFARIADGEAEAYTLLQQALG
jgi:hypothetical protein